MPLPAPIPADQSFIAGISSDPALSADFLPEMETALDAALSASCGSGTSCIPVDTVSGPGSSEDANRTPLFGPSPPSTLAPALLKRGKAELRASLSSLIQAAPDQLASAPQDPNPSASLFNTQAPIFPLAGLPNKDVGKALTEQHLPQVDSSSYAVALPVILPADSAPAPALEAFGLPLVSPDLTDAAPAAQIAEPLAQTPPSATNLPVPPLPEAATLPAPPSGSRPGRIGFKPTSFPASSLPSPFATPDEPLPDLGGPPAASPQIEQASAGDASGSPVFEAFIRQLDSNPTAESALTAHPAKPLDHLSRAPLPAKQPAARAVAPRAASALPGSTPGASNDTPDNPNPDDSSHLRQSHSQAAAASPSTASLQARNSAADGSFNAAPSFETSSDSLPGPAVSNDAAPHATGPESPAHMEPVLDLDPTASSPDALHEVSFKLESADGAAVHLKFTERRGEVHVVTRTEDAGLSEKLASDLPGLRKAIEDSGMSADIWSAGLESAALNESDSARSDSGPNPGNQSSAWFRQGDSGGRRQGGHQQGWADQIEDALDGAQGGPK